MAQSDFLNPKRDHIQNIKYVFLFFFAWNPKRDLHGYIWAAYDGIFPRTLKVRPKSQMYGPNQDKCKPPPTPRFDFASITFIYCR